MNIHNEMNVMNYFHVTTKIIFSQYSDWTSVKREVEMDHNLEKVPLQILSNVKLGESSYIYLMVENIGFLRIEFMFKRFGIHPCGNYAFPSNLPVEVNKIWTISRTKEALTILCNGVEVLNLVYIEDDMNCFRAWSKDSTKITFGSQDDASDYAKSLGQGKFCLALLVIVTKYLYFIDSNNSLFHGEFDQAFKMNQ